MSRDGQIGMCINKLRSKGGRCRFCCSCSVGCNVLRKEAANISNTELAKMKARLRAQAGWAALGHVSLLTWFESIVDCHLHFATENSSRGAGADVFCDVC